MLLAWLIGEQHEPEVMEGIAQTARDIHDGKAVLITSVLTFTEIYESKLSEEAKRKLEDLFKRRLVVPIETNMRIARLAQEIREYYANRGHKMGSPDSIHLATAILNNADEFHTTDGSGKRKRPTDLLRLSGNVAGKYTLPILLPRALPKPEQTGLFQTP